MRDTAQAMGFEQGQVFDEVEAAVVAERGPG